MEYLISDTHFNHKKIIEYCNRPLDYEERIAKSLSLVHKEDILIHLGDICCGKDVGVHKKYIQPIKGRKILVRGNHDSKSDFWYMDHGWDFVCDSFTLEKYGATMCFSHIPRPWDGIWTVNIHGHLHTFGRIHACKDYLRQWHQLISCEENNYQLYSLRVIAEKFPKAVEYREE